MITSPDNSQLKLIRKLRRKKERDASGLFVAEGEDLVGAAEAAGWAPEVLLVSGEDVEPELLDRVSSLGSGSRVIGVYRQRWSEPRGDLCVYLHGVGDPGNVGTVIRSAHALADGPVILGPGCADPYGPKAVRASMGSLFARPPARGEPGGTLIALDAAGGPLHAVAGRAARGALRGRRARRPSDRAAGGGHRHRGDPGAPRRPGLAQRRDGRHRRSVRARE